MEVIIHIPLEFESHFNKDKFADSFQRITADLKAEGLLAGNYEIELLEMLESEFQNAVIINEDVSRINSIPKPSRRPPMPPVKPPKKERNDEA